MPPDPQQQRVSVEFDYPVVFTDDLLDPANPALVDALTRGPRDPADRRHRVLVVVDGGVDACWPDLPQRLGAYADRHRAHMALVGAPIVVPGGEACKQGLEVVQQLWAKMAAVGLDRHSFVLVIGGGAVMDAVGFAAATCHRGVRLIRAPTTVLGQNDAGVGVKNGVNLHANKNFAGAFAPPWAVLNDIRFIDTLPARDRRAGLAESVKVALIRDQLFFHWLKKSARALGALEQDALAYAIRRGAELHLQHIATSGDPFELGSARPLDFGHWSAHKLEALSDHALRHGEAVAIGMAIDTLYSERVGMLDAADARAIIELLEAIGLPLWHESLDLRAPDGRLQVLDGLDEFRQHLGGRLTVTLLQGVGRGEEVGHIDEALVTEIVAHLRERRAVQCA